MTKQLTALALFLTLSMPAAGQSTYEPTSDGDRAPTKTMGEVMAENQAKREQKLKEVFGTDTLSTDPETWGADAWGALKWGMGYVDVAKALKADFFLDSWKTPGGRVLVFEPSQPVVGEEVRLLAGFSEDRLIIVNIEPRSKAPAIRKAWMAKVLKGLKLKYGQPYEESSQGAMWMTESLSIIATINEQKVWYNDIQFMNADMEAQRRAELEKATEGL